MRRQGNAEGIPGSRKWGLKAIGSPFENPDLGYCISNPAVDVRASLSVGERPEEEDQRPSRSPITLASVDFLSGFGGFGAYPWSVQLRVVSLKVGEGVPCSQRMKRFGWER